MTRLLSNLIKSGYIFYDKEEAKVIDSDSKLGYFKPLSFPKIEVPQEASAEEAQIDFDELMEVKKQEYEEVDDYFRGEQEQIQEEVNLLVEEARKQSDTILQEAQMQAEQIRAQAFEEGKSDGYQAGITQAMQELEEEKQKLEEEKRKNQAEYEEQLKQMEPYFVDIMIRYIEKLTGVMIEDKKEIILYLIHNALRKVERNHSFIIKVSQEDYSFVEQQKEKLMQGMKEDVKLDIVEDFSLKKNQCMIETDDRMIDCSLDVQLGRLMEDLRLLSISDV